MKKENVYIIIPVHNRKVITLQCLDVLNSNGDLEKYHVVVVDDGSTDGTSEAIHSLYPKVIILKGDGNLWWTGAIKKGMEYAYEKGAEYLVWLNDDCLVESSPFADLVAFCQHNDNSIIGCQGMESKDKNKINFGGKKKKIINYYMIKCLDGKIEECDLLSGNLVCIPSKVIDKINYPDSKRFPHYGGDSSYLIHARKSGFKIFVKNHPHIFNLSEQSSINDHNWLLKNDKTLYIVKLIFNPYSVYSWRLWLNLSKVEYGNIAGLIFFGFYYILYFLIPILFITVLRLLPLESRYKLSEVKRNIVYRK